MAEYTFIIKRFDPAKDKKPYEQTFKVPKIASVVTILDALNYIKENIDSSLSYRHSCRMAICGSCAVRVNGIPKLACITKIAQLEGNTVRLEPLSKYPVIKDLVVDLEPFFRKHEMVKPYLINKHEDIYSIEPDKELKQTPEQLARYIQFAYCIKCGSCYSVCMGTPDLSKGVKGFMGPQALAQAFRYIVDNRDEGYYERMEVVASPEGVFRCHFAGSCSAVCGKGCDPALALQLLRRMVLFGKKC
ncbi:succinate dehydrogenase iron-sulfur subunit [Desulfurobacterium atlanticum]|uniref:Succinate dehydrogenase subunit B n=1 Tax=Desulfurobacterium atlanticum TaxID=240169 RepID=A0A238Y7L4_9BACT|nr:succinate dehydrogenase iron-sulfur subunit [Desulfurobacterium atlanticum]SNR67215.1 succinate dehydrogenase subunit B [Desulfurobacterium atlanticum]